MPTTALRSVPRDQRPRERLLALSPRTLTDAELLAILLGSGRRGENVVDLAIRLLRSNGGLGGLCRLDAAALAREPGIGPAKATRVVAALTLGTRAVTDEDARPVIARSRELARVAMPLFADARRERVVLVICGPGNRLLATVTLADGSAHGAAFPVREMLAEVLRRDGVAFGVAHNHPNGDPTPSTADVRATTALRSAAAQVGIRMLDHVVLAGTAWASASAPG